MYQALFSESLLFLMVQSFVEMLLGVKCPCSFPTQSPNFLVTPPKAPTITGITWALFEFHILIISLLKSWYFSIFSPSFSSSLESPGAALSTIKQLLFLIDNYTVRPSSFNNMVTLDTDIPQDLDSQFSYSPLCS